MRTRLGVLAILAVGWLGFLLYAYPGYLSFDSIVQLREARSGVFTDWHPPAMAFLWRLVEHVIRGPFGMLTLQTTTFLVGGYLLLARYLKPLVAAIFAVVLFWLPPVSSTMAVIWKDSQMTGYLLLGLGLLLSERARTRYIGLALLLVATTMRHNGFTFTLPLIVILWRWPWQGAKRYAASLGLWLATTLVAFGINGALTEVKMHPWHGSIALHDIAGTLRYANANDDEIRADLVGVPMTATDHLYERLRATYVPAAGVFPLVAFIPQPIDDTQRAAVQAAWKRVVSAYPGSYLKHRYKVFKHVLGVTDPHGPIWVGTDTAGADLYEDRPSETQASMRDWMLQVVANSWSVRPFLYMIVIIALLYNVVKSRDRFLIALASSAIISEAVLFFVSPTPDFRYSLWLVPTAFILVITLFLTRARSLRKV